MAGDGGYRRGWGCWKWWRHFSQRNKKNNDSSHLINSQRQSSKDMLQTDHLSYWRKQTISRFDGLWSAWKNTHNIYFTNDLKNDPLSERLALEQKSFIKCSDKLTRSQRREEQPTYWLTPNSTSHIDLLGKKWQFIKSNSLDGGHIRDIGKLRETHSSL